jgi:hypothetical protein
VSLYDGKFTSTYTLTVTVVNNPPVFVSSLPASITLAVNGARSFQMQDYENNPISFTASDDRGLNPPYVTSNATFLTIKATSLASLGTRSLNIKLFDGGSVLTGVVSYYTMTVIFTNSAPTFISSTPVSQTLANGASLNYALPAYSDAEGNAITVLLNPTFSWATIVGGTNLVLTKPPLSAVGTQAMTLTLTDTDQATSYYFNIVVTNTAPTFVTTPPAS